VIERWNWALATGRDMWWSPTIRAAPVAGMPWLEVYCPGCQTIRALDIRTIDRHPLYSKARICSFFSTCVSASFPALLAAAIARSQPSL
jgi:hypothetical protein